MASSTAGGGHYLFLFALSALLCTAAYGQLSEQYYSTQCQQLLNEVVEQEVRSSLNTEGRRMGASLLRLFFHDCFVQGCDASILLDDDQAKGIVSEKNAGPNFNSLRGLDVIDRIKDKVEAQEQCRGNVSCADILALATKQAVSFLGGPELPFLLGRRDSTTANMAEAQADLPSPSSDVTRLIRAFEKKGFTARELVTLSGAHTIGMAHCGNVDDNSQKYGCRNDSSLLPLDKNSEEKFDNNYYMNLANKDGLLHSDRVLVEDVDLRGLVEGYAMIENLFFRDFAIAMKKLSELGVLTGPNNGQIRGNCRKVN